MTMTALPGSAGYGHEHRPGHPRRGSTARVEQGGITPSADRLTQRRRAVGGRQPVWWCPLVMAARTRMAAAVEPAITIAIGTAERVPARPTSGAAAAPTTYCSRPNRAEALPAMFTGRPDSARATELG